MAAPALHLVADRDRLREAIALHARVWEPAGRAVVEDLGLAADARVLDVGPGAARDLGAGERFDLVHARFQLSLRGSTRDRLGALRDRVAPGGVLLLEEPDTRSLVYAPHAPAATHLVGRVAQVMKAAGGDLDAGRQLPALLRGAGLAPCVRTHVIGLEAGHPYLRLPLDLADAYAGPLADILGGDGLCRLRRRAVEELDDPERCGTTFTLVQAWARV